MYMKNGVCDISFHHFVLMLMRCIRYCRHWNTIVYIDGLGQEKRNSSTLAMDFRVSCTNACIKCFADWDRDKMAYFVQTTSSYALSYKTSLLWFEFQLNLIYLNQCWLVVSWTLRNKLTWNFDQSAMEKIALKSRLQKVVYIVSASMG